MIFKESKILQFTMKLSIFDNANTSRILQIIAKTVTIAIAKFIFETVKDFATYNESSIFEIRTANFSNMNLSLLHDNFSASTTFIVKRAHRVYWIQQSKTLVQFNLLNSNFEYDKNYSKKTIKKRKKFEATLKIDDFIHVMLQFRDETSLSSLNEDQKVSFEEAMNNTILIEYVKRINDEKTMKSRDIWKFFEFSFSFSLLEFAFLHHF